jgi:lipoprotein-anchoring transpeptidase ErfK/SrfK
MKRVFLALPLVLGFVVAGSLSTGVVAGTTASTTAPTPTSTVPVTTAPPPTTTAPVNATPLPPAAPTLARGISVAGVRVGGLQRPEAEKAVQAAFARPLRVFVDGTSYKLDPRDYATAYTATAIARARIATPPTNVQLVVSVHGAAVRAWANRVAKHFARKPVDGSLSFKGARPVVKGSVPGRRLDAAELTAKVVGALTRNTRLPVHVHTRKVPAKLTGGANAPLIVIDRGHNRLVLYHGAKPVRTFPVATGQAIYPTPAGTFHIVVKQRDPWWYPPTYDSWAKGLQPVPPGPNNPLGTRWMGLSVPGVGIHGTDEPASIGYSRSHGCIRMQVPDAEWLFDRVQVGTTVHIV